MAAQRIPPRLDRKESQTNIALLNRYFQGFQRSLAFTQPERHECACEWRHITGTGPAPQLAQNAPRGCGLSRNAERVTAEPGGLRVPAGIAECLGEFGERFAVMPGDAPQLSEHDVRDPELRSKFEDAQERGHGLFVAPGVVQELALVGVEEARNGICLPCRTNLRNRFRVPAQIRVQMGQKQSSAGVAGIQLARAAK